MSPTLLSKFQLGFIIISYFITYFIEHFLRVSFNQIDTYFLFVHPYYQNYILELRKPKVHTNYAIQEHFLLRRGGVVLQNGALHSW